MKMVNALISRGQIEKTGLIGPVRESSTINGTGRMVGSFREVFFAPCAARPFPSCA
jgi:hypothetical protein